MDVNGAMALLAFLAILLALTSGALYVWYVKPGFLIGSLRRLSLVKSKMRVKYVQGKTYKYCYAEKNQVNPNHLTMVMVHGFSGSKDNWVSVIDLLPGDLHIISVDLPGHGGTTPVPGEKHDINPLAMTHILHEFIDAIGLNGRVHIVGVSMGATISALHASQYPGDISMLTIVCPALSFDTPWQTTFMKEVELTGNSTKLVPTCIEETLEMLHAIIYDKEKIPSNKQILLGILQDRMSRNDFYRRLVKALMDEKKNKSHEIPGHLRSIKCSTQIVWGENDELLDVKDAHVLKERIPRCDRLDILDRCGHSVYWDAPDRLAECILSFRGDQTGSNNVENNVKIIIEDTALLEDTQA